MDPKVIEYLQKSLDTLAVLPSVIQAGARVVTIITEARAVLDAGTVTDEQFEEQTKRIEALRDELHRP